jgi:hypothetical protein
VCTVLRLLLSITLLLVLAPPAAATAAGPGARPAVVGGSPATAADWPSIAFLLAAWDGDGKGASERSAGCTGTVIAPEWILSAAHCAFRPDGQRVDGILALTGAADIGADEAEWIPADDWVVHPDWSEATLAGDALLIHLEDPSVRPAMALARAGGDYERDPTVPNLAGWGATDENSTLFTEVLQEAYVSILDDATCAGFDPLYDPATKTCALERGEARACHGDSGGPLTVLGAAGEPRLWGLTSYNPPPWYADEKPCDLRVPVIFTRVPALAGWVDAEIGNVPVPSSGAGGPGLGGNRPAAPPPAPPADTRAPVLSAVKLSTRRIRAARRGATIARKAGARLSFSLDEAAAVTVAVRKGGKPRGEVATFAADAGRTTKRFSARVGGRKLARGRYRLRVSAVDVAGNAAPSRTIGFKVV